MYRQRMVAHSIGLRCDESVIEEIEATVTIPANGGSNFNGTSANQVGQLESMAMIARFINEEITTERVVTLMAQNVEKADDTYRNPISRYKSKQCECSKTTSSRWYNKQ